MYSIVIPEIFSYDDGIMETSFFEGKNLETLLRTKENHNLAVSYINKLLEFILYYEFRW